MSATAAEVWLQVSPRLQRMGLKGPRAAAWLADRGVAIPAQANTAAILSDGAMTLLVARLGMTEFFLEDAERVAEIRSALGTGAPGVYPVLREDSAFLLGGARVHDVLTQVCNIDFAALGLAANPVVMTMMAGVAVVVVPQEEAGQRSYRLWCDPSYGAYLQATLAAIVTECGGKVPAVGGLRP